MTEPDINVEQLREDNYVIKFIELPNFVRALMITPDVRVLVPESDKQLDPFGEKLAGDEVRVILQYSDSNHRNLFNLNYAYLQKGIPEEV